VDIEGVLSSGREPVLRFFARTTDRAQAEDLAQETLLRAFRALDRGERPERPAPWLLGIARNVLLEWLRSSRYERGLQERLAAVFGPGSEPPFPDALARRLVVADAMEDLPKDLREPVALHYFEGMGVVEVGRHLGISSGAVKTRLWRARLNLRDPLISLTDKEEAVTVFDHLHVLLHAGGTRGATAPLGPDLFDGDGMSVGELREAVDRLHLLHGAGDVPLSNTLYVYPSLDPFENVDPAGAWAACRAGDIGQDAWNAEWDSGLIPSDGWRLGTDPNAESLIDDFKKVGLRRVHFTLLGARDTHDSLAGRTGAFDAILRAMDLCEASGVHVSTNVIVSSNNVREVDETVQIFRDHGGGWLAVYPPDKTYPAYEEVRPEAKELEALHPERWKRTAESAVTYADFWRDPGAFTEGVLTAEALEDDTSALPEWYGPPLDRRAPTLSVDASFDLHAGTIWERPTLRVGNLRVDSPTQLHRAIAALGPPKAPPDRELASRYGDSSSLKVYVNRSVLRTKWLRRWRMDADVAWLEADHP
jgi:RNA polymerase sigma-70 factor (ECF subfamily)